MGDRWLVDDPTALACREWGEECVVYVGSEAQTHLLGASAGQLLRALMALPGPASADELFEAAFQGFDEGPDAAASSAERAAVLDILGDFERKGIAHRSAS